EQDKSSQLSNVVEPLLCARALGLGPAGPPDDGGDGGDERDRDPWRRLCPGRLSPKELGRTVPERVLAREDREAGLVAADVLSELFGGRVSSLRLLPHRHQDDVVEIALQFPAQLLRRVLTGAWRFRFRFTDRALVVERGMTSDAVRGTARQ